MKTYQDGARIIPDVDHVRQGSCPGIACLRDLAAARVHGSVRGVCTACGWSLWIEGRTVRATLCVPGDHWCGEQGPERIPPEPAPEPSDGLLDLRQAADLLHLATLSVRCYILSGTFARPDEGLGVRGRWSLETLAAWSAGRRGHERRLSA